MFKKNTLSIIIFIILIVATLLLGLFLFFNKNYLLNKIVNRKTMQENLKIDKIFLMNLDIAPDRLKNAKSVLLKMGLKEKQIERFPGTYWTDIEIYDYKNNKTFTGRDVKAKKESFRYGNTYQINCSKELSFDYEYKDDKFYPEHKQALSIGYIGNICSHLRILKESLRRNYDNILVFEDDVKPIDKDLDFTKILQRVASQLPQDYEMVTLGNQLNNFNNTLNKKIEAFFKVKQDKRLINNFSDFYNLFQGNFALLFSKKGAKVFLTKSKKIKTLISDILYSKISNENKKTYFINPPLFYQTINESSTEGTTFKFFPKIFLLNSGKNPQNMKNLIFAMKESDDFNNANEIINYQDFQGIKIKFSNRLYNLADLQNTFNFQVGSSYDIICSHSVKFEYKPTAVNNNYAFYEENIKLACASLTALDNYVKNKDVNFSQFSRIIFIKDSLNHLNIDYFINNFMLFRSAGYDGTDHWHMPLVTVTSINLEKNNYHNFKIQTTINQDFLGLLDKTSLFFYNSSNHDLSLNSELYYNFV